MEGSEMWKLAPSGTSPWNHQIDMENGKLTLYWRKEGEEAVRTFTVEETSNLLNFLMLHKHEIDLACYRELMP